MDMANQSEQVVDDDGQIKVEMATQSQDIVDEESHVKVEFAECDQGKYVIWPEHNGKEKQQNVFVNA